MDSFSGLRILLNSRLKLFGLTKCSETYWSYQKSLWYNLGESLLLFLGLLLLAKPLLLLLVGVVLQNMSSSDGQAHSIGSMCSMRSSLELIWMKQEWMNEWMKWIKKEQVTFFRLWFWVNENFPKLCCWILKYVHTASRLQKNPG